MHGNFCLTFEHSKNKTKKNSQNWSTCWGAIVLSRPVYHTNGITRIAVSRTFVSSSAPELRVPLLGYPGHFLWWLILMAFWLHRSCKTMFDIHQARIIVRRHRTCAYELVKEIPWLFFTYIFKKCTYEYARAAAFLMREKLKIDTFFMRSISARVPSALKSHWSIWSIMEV